MGILQLLARKDEASVPKRGALLKKVFKVLFERHAYFQLVVLFSIFILPASNVQVNLYRDENAMNIPKSREQWIYADLQYVAPTIKSLSSATSSTQMADIIKQEFLNSRLVVDSQEFLLNNSQGNNIYAALSRKTIPLSETTLFSAPLFCADGSDNFAGVSILLNIARKMNDMGIWSRSPIFLISTNSPLGECAWLNSYYGLNSHYGLSSHYKLNSHYNLQNQDKQHIKMRRGYIRDAVSVQVCNNNKDFYANLDYIGYLGILPNEDMTNLASSSIKICSLPTKPPSTYFNRLKNLFNFIVQQTVYPKKTPTYIFSKLGIESFTLSFNGEFTENITYETANNITCALDAIIRNLNNLSERLHHHTWLYMSTGIHTIIPVTAYLIPLFLSFLLSLIFFFQSYRSPAIPESPKYKLEGRLLLEFKNNRISNYFKPSLNSCLEILIFPLNATLSAASFATILLINKKFDKSKAYIVSLGFVLAHIATLLILDTFFLKIFVKDFAKNVQSRIKATLLWIIAPLELLLSVANPSLSIIICTFFLSHILFSNAKCRLLNAFSVVFSPMCLIAILMLAKEKFQEEIAFCSACSSLLFPALFTLSLSVAPLSLLSVPMYAKDKK